MNSNIVALLCQILIHLQYTYAIGIALGRIYFAYGEYNFGNPKTMTDTKRYIKSKLARAARS